MLAKVYFSKKPFSPFFLTRQHLLFSSTAANRTSGNPEINKLLSKISSDISSKTPYIHKFNYNFEQNKTYTKNIEKSLLAASEKAKRERAKATSPASVDRRKRRVYDRPLHDLDLTKYSVWRVYDRIMPKFEDDAHPIVCKLIVAPFLLQKVRCFIDFFDKITNKI